VRPQTPLNYSDGLAQVYDKYRENDFVDRRLCARLMAECLLNTARFTRANEPDRSRAAAGRRLRLRPAHMVGWLLWLSGAVMATTKRR